MGKMGLTHKLSRGRIKKQISHREGGDGSLRSLGGGKGWVMTTWSDSEWVGWGGRGQWGKAGKVSWPEGERCHR
ncbi:hypothetical protein TIFTF001_017321 [Ficus carica]|uniref:Uncharacterized protein n=1 Tax=Ficus carica TaxID=3494 RepID=A0AA88D6W2_FICCA|nr:hypothetical protein TIFTF001_017321 [Ficus carica]